MAIKEIKSKFPGKCAKCGRDIKEGWTIGYDADEKKVYCMPCVKEMGSVGSGGNSGVVTCEQCQSEIPAASMFCPNCGAAVYHAPTIEQMVEAQSGSLALLIESISIVDEKLRAINSDIVSLRTKIDALSTAKKLKE